MILKKNSKKIVALFLKTSILDKYFSNLTEQLQNNYEFFTQHRPH
jgi:hypothetical protein